MINHLTIKNMAANKRVRCWNCQQLKHQKNFYQLADGRYLSECLSCEEKSRELYKQAMIDSSKNRNRNRKIDFKKNTLLNGQYLVPELDYRTDTYSWSFLNKTCLIIPSKMNEL